LFSVVLHSYTEWNRFEQNCCTKNKEKYNEAMMGGSTNQQEQNRLLQALFSYNVIAGVAISNVK